MSAFVSLKRVGAMVLRYSYVLRSSGFRLLEIVYWPIVQLFTWGFLQTYLIKARGGAPASGVEVAAGALVGGVLLLDILLRAQQGFSFSFLEEMWSRNLANLLMSPLRMHEFALALMAMSVIRLAISTLPVSFLAIYIFGFNLWALGAALGAFFAILTLLRLGRRPRHFGPAAALRHGRGESRLGPDVRHSAARLVYYPVAVLPAWVQPFSWSLPPTYVFEGLRAILLDHVVRWDLLAQGFALDVVLFALAAVLFSRLLTSARRAGTLLQTGE